jgi:PIN domain nuclease of toxin-antitoxin system
MIYLLDTHILLWAAGEPHRLSGRARMLLADPHNTLVFSAASIWEVSIKSALGSDAFHVSSAVLRRGLLEAGYQELEISSAYAVAVGELPPLHRDPFDRMLVAQSRVEGLTLLTRDKQVAAYGAPVSLFE